MQAEWRKKVPINTYDEDDSVIQKLIAINGIEDVFRFINPTAEELHDPFLLKNMEAARDRIVQAIELGQYISIFSDIDSDGISSTAIMYQYLLNYGNCVQYFHSQRSMGHGVQTSLKLIPESTELLIIVDSSSNETESCKMISKKGIDIIIIDHHTVEKSNPHCILVNPHQEGCSYPNKYASGSILTYKVCVALDEYFHENYSDSLVDLAAFGALSDMMKLGIESLENRFLVNYMLDNIQNLGLKAILKVVGKEKDKLYSSTIGYNLTPFVNAPTRLDRIEIPLELLTTDDPERALELAKSIKELNEQRKAKQKEAVLRLKNEIDENDKCIVIIDSSLGRGYNGLVANDLASIYQRPVVILGENGEEYSGSFRSYGGFDFLKLVADVEQITNSGGHAEAGGLSFKKSDLLKVKNIISYRLSNEQFNQVHSYEFEIDPEDINEKLATQVQNFYRVSGTGFEEAKFLIRNLVINQKKVVGSGDTLRLGCLIESDTWFMDAEDIENAKPKMLLMKFKADERFIEGINVGDKVDVIGSLNLNIWTKYKPKYEIVKTLQLFIEDYRVL